MNPWQSSEGNSSPLGVTWIHEEQAFNFAVFSEHATAIELLLFVQNSYTSPVKSFEFDPLKNRSGRTWHMRIPISELGGALYYAYRVHGPFDPALGQRFDSEKLLVDPYAKGVIFPPGYQRSACSQPGDTLGKAPLGALPRESVADYDWEDDAPPQRHKHDLIIYELHVKGFTQDHSSGLAQDIRGTYSGLIEKIPHLVELGITAVELMPVFQFDPQENNYWGYMTLNFFSPHHAYSNNPQVCQQINEFRDMVKALHKANIEVILDVVYNHTAESDENGPTYSFRGFDNKSYYLLDAQGQYHNHSGTGNVFKTSNRFVRRLVVDSLRFWVREMHVDGFRFDLASIFTRESDGSVNIEDPAIISDITSDPDFQNIRLIAEAWDISTYQLGQQFPGISWMQWNGQYRDSLRRWIKSDENLVSELMTRLYGSSDLFPDTLPDVYRPFQSINFITAHDGFTLYDLVSYNQKYNEINGNNNTDGTNNNNSWNHGWEGDIGAPEPVIALRKQQIRNFITLLMISNGSPMIVMGDEFLNTQEGNNNPYNQDSSLTWINWDQRTQNQAMFLFFKHIIAFRKRHPTFGRSRFWRGDIRWYGVGPNVDFSPHSRSLAFFLDGTTVGDSDMYVMINTYWEPLNFSIQEGSVGDWRIAVDTKNASVIDPNSPSPPLVSQNIIVDARSIIVLIKM